MILIYWIIVISRLSILHLVVLLFSSSVLHCLAIVIILYIMWRLDLSSTFVHLALLPITISGSSIELVVLQAALSFLRRRLAFVIQIVLS